MGKQLLPLRSFALLLSVLIIQSCSSPKNMQYIQGAFDTTVISKLIVPETTVQKGDLLTVTVYSDNELATRPFNQQDVSMQGNATSQTPGDPVMQTSILRGRTYLVDGNGNINFPVIGTIKVDNLSRFQLIDLLNSKLLKYLSNPYYDIRFANFKITLIGEVTRPGVYNIPNERVNILEAIGLAGDLTFFGKRENVLVIREANGHREFGRVDLSSPDVFKSPYYFLRQNDVVIVDMSKRKLAANDQIAFRNISLAATIVSAIAVLISVLR